jgi:excisionase family DNA binding protein
MNNGKIEAASNLVTESSNKVALQAKDFPEVLTAQQVADLIKVKPVTIYSWASAGKIPHIRIDKVVRFDKEEVLRWFLEHQRNS